MSTAPVHGQARRELFVAEETTQNSVEIPTVHEAMTDETLRKLETMIDALSPFNGLTDLAVRMESITAKVENVALMAQWKNVCPLPDPSEAVPWKRRKIFPWPQILEEKSFGTYDEHHDELERQSAEHRR